MLIINADDWGRSGLETDAARACYEKEAVTSVSAMVFMEDSQRAATIAREGGIATGLHLNLSEEFTGPGVPREITNAQKSIARFLCLNKYALIIYHPLLRWDIRRVWKAQSDEFARLYGQGPTHVDGHQHMHLCSNMLFDQVLPAGLKVRRSFSFWPGEKSVLNRMYRLWVDQKLARRYRLTDYFFALPQCIGSGNLPRVLDLARSSNVELMAHPVHADESGFLLSNQWRDKRAGVRAGSYGEL